MVSALVYIHEVRDEFPNTTDCDAMDRQKLSATDAVKAKVRFIEVLNSFSFSKVSCKTKEVRG